MAKQRTVGPVSKTPSTPPSLAPAVATEIAPPETFVERVPQTHIVQPGDKVREPDEMEVLARQPIAPPIAVADELIRERLKRFIAQAAALKVDERTWRGLSPFTRYAIVGARALAQEVLGEKDENGRTASLTRTLGLDVATGRTIAHGT